MLRRFRRNADALQIEVTYRPDGVGYHLRLSEAGQTQPVTLPLREIRRFVRQREFPRLALLDSLWEEEVLSEWAEPGAGGYWLRRETLFELDPEDRQVLGLPEPSPIDIALRVQGTVGLPTFAIVPEVHHPEKGYLHRIGRREGPFYLLPDGEVVLLTPPAAQLLDEVDRRPASTADQPEYVARVKAAARAAGARLDPYLEQEEYYLVNEVDFDLDLQAPDHLELIPRLSELPPAVEEEVRKSLPGAPAYIPLPRVQGRWRRVFFTPRARRVIRQWREQPSIRGQDVPRFLQNPAPFLPEEVDLSRFGDRVKGISLRVYRVRPYLAARSGDRGWFDLDLGAHQEPMDLGSLVAADAAETPGRPVGADPSPEGDAGAAVTGAPAVDVDGRGGAVRPAAAGPQPDSGGEPIAGDLADGEGQVGADPGSLTLDDLKELAALAQEQPAEPGAEGDSQGRLVFWRGSWVQVPPDLNQYVQSGEELLAQYPERRIPSARLSYMLDIYSNIEELEYSPELVAYRAQLEAEESGDEPEGFNGTLKPHQREGLKWIKRLHRLRLGGLLADDMGLGKTVQVLAFMAFLHQRDELRPSLVVMPRAVWKNWEDELKRFCPHLRVRRHGGPQRDRLPERLARWDVVLTTYETLNRDQFIMGQVDWQMVVTDEAQKIKNMTALATRAAKALKARLRLAVTGTPVENSLGDLWSVVDFAQPGLLGSYQEFRRRYEEPLRRRDPETVATVERDLVRTLSPIYKRRTKWEHLRDELPPKEEHRAEVPLGRQQRTLYQEVLTSAQGQKGAALGALQRLLQVCSHPALADGSWASMSGQKLLSELPQVPKLQRTLEILGQIREAGEKALIVTHWRGMQQILQRVIAERYGIRPPAINGELADRKGTVDWFNAQPGFGVMILSPKAGGVGLNLVSANHVIHYSRWWNPAVENQATDRVHRIGQTRPVHVYFPIVTAPEGETVEQVLDALLAEKRQLAERVIIPSTALEVSPKDMAQRLGLEY